MLFGKHIGRKKKNNIKRFIGFKTIKELNYLGLKIALRRLKYEDYQFIIENALKKLNQWASKLLSLAGKLTLVKTVLLALPTFHASHSLVPKRVLEDLDIACKNFIWCKNNGKGMHYVNWLDMCKPINCGGRNLHSNNLKTPSLRARLAWRFIQNKDSLLNNMLASKYGDNMDKVVGRRCSSSTYKLLNEGLKMLKPIVKWSLVNGDSVDVYKDIWILDKSLDKWPTFVIPHDSNPALVSKFIQNGSWNVELLMESFGRDLVNLITQIMITQEGEEDRMELIHQKYGLSIGGLAYKESIAVSQDD
ncbi:hypothetical protein KFK09_026535 [Dendrobium nobile]|uniref:Uncharacterized protein n=1 Tax=Dendrobium nobile TaxID=94219 RepID=A0A8T3A6S9_DENNO|nr:hypothetical protein KFK09_026535 [Dendrobium nobile]